MTHTLHRLGSREDLARDYVLIMISAKGLNDSGSAPAKRRFFEIVEKYNPVNTGDPIRGSQATLGFSEVKNGARDGTICQAVFRDAETVAAVLKELNRANLGQSTVVAGLFDEVERCCAKSGLKPHTVEYSLGTWGRTERLGNGKAMEVSTMCGHGMVPVSLVRHLAEQVQVGRLTSEEAASKMTRLCTCAVFNTARAAELVAAMATSRVPL